MFGDKQRNFAVKAFSFVFRSKQRSFAVKVFLFFFTLYTTDAIATSLLIARSYFVNHSFHLLYSSLNFQAIIIVAKLSFWINKPFLPSVTEALNQYKQKGYVQKLKTDITPDFMHSDHYDLVALLYRQVTHIDGMYSVSGSCTTYQQFMAGS